MIFTFYFWRLYKNGRVIEHGPLRQKKNFFIRINIIVPVPTVNFTCTALMR